MAKIADGGGSIKKTIAKAPAKTPAAPYKPQPAPAKSTGDSYWATRAKQPQQTEAQKALIARYSAPVPGVTKSLTKGGSTLVPGSMPAPGAALASGGYTYIPPSSPGGGRGTMLPDQKAKGDYLRQMAAQLGVTPAELLVLGNNFALQSEIDALQTGGGDGSVSGGGEAAATPGIVDEGVKMFEWDEGGYQAAGGNAPSWWTAFVPKETTPETAYGAMLNAMIPYLSPQDQVRIAHQLYGMFDTEMSRYKPGYIPEVATLTQEQADYMARMGRPMTEESYGSHPVTLNTGETITTGQKRYDVMSEDMRRYLSSSQRAADALTTLSNMREKMVGGDRWKLGAGYKWLQNILGTQNAFGGAGSSGQRRLDYEAQTAALDPFLSQASSGELAPFGPLGQAVTTPFYSAGMLMPYSSGRYGTPNRRFF